MRIGICGVSSTGKSTLAREVAKRSGVPLVWEDDILQAARNKCDLEGMNLPIQVYKYTPEEHLAFERKFLEVEYEQEKKLDHFITDRSPLDTMNWMMYLCNQTMPPEEFNGHMDKLTAILKTYEAIFYLPYGVLPIVNDNRRHTNPNMLFTMDMCLRGLVEKFEDVVPMYEMYSVNLEDRVKAVMACFKPYTPPSLDSVME